MTVVSDEIHCDLTDPQCKYVPFASVSDVCRDNSITCVAPTKAFNIAGLQTAAIMIPNALLRHKVWRGLNTDEVAEPNAFAIDAAIAAFTKCADWLDELNAYISENKKFVAEYIASEIPCVKVVPSQATYLLWLDCTKMEGTAADITQFVRDKTGLYLSEGSQFGDNSEHFIRMNVACPQAVLKDGLTRFRDGVAALDFI